MLHDLFKLYRNNKSGLRTPLEDFTTEAFTGVLQQHKDVLAPFVQFIGLNKGENYRVNTQVRKFLGESYYIIDMVLESSQSICFIENKVNSKEGGNQLNNYAALLYLEKKDTYLRYCTKRVEVKTVKDHNFKQYRWYEEANILYINHNDKPLVQDFVEFFKKTKNGTRQYNNYRYSHSDA